MKALLFSALAALTLTATAHADDHAQLATQAKAEFAQRGYDNNGISHAKAAAELYDKAAAVAPDATAKAEHLISKSEALYFVGGANQQRDIKIDAHLKGMEAGDAGLKLLGVASVAGLSDAALQGVYGKLNDAQKHLVGEGLYYRGINLGQWGAANGVVDSLSKWPELRRNMELIKAIGLSSIHDFGANRVLGRGYFKVPSLLGGNMKEATKLLKEAVEGSKVDGQVFSKSGFNNVYYAEVLKENGDDDQAVALLEAFSKYDDGTPETREAVREAKELLKSW